MYRLNTQRDRFTKVTAILTVSVVAMKLNWYCIANHFKQCH